MSPFDRTPGDASTCPRGSCQRHGSCMYAPCRHLTQQDTRTTEQRNEAWLREQMDKIMQETRERLAPIIAALVEIDMRKPPKPIIVTREMLTGMRGSITPAQARKLFVHAGILNPVTPVIAQPEWGEPIAVDGKRPDWLHDGETFKIWTASTQRHGVGPIEGFEWVEIREIALPTSHPYYLATLRGFTYWPGGEEGPPVDWDGGPVLWSQGPVCLPAAPSSWYVDRLTHGVPNVIGYHRKPDDLPEGLWERDGKIMFTCKGCDNPAELQGEVSEFNPDMAFCGGAPWCCP